MRFAEPLFAYGIWLVLLLGFLFFWMFKMRINALERFAEKTLLNEIASSVSFKRKTVKATVLIIVLILSLFSLMRPQWGFQWQEVKRKGLDILIAIDTSKSMLASDAKPTRLERSKLAVRDLVKKLAGDRLGLIAFSGTAFLQCPLTADYDGFLLALNDLSVDIIPRGGTSVSSAIKEAIKSYEGGEKYKVLVIITDGEDHEGDAVRLAQEAGKDNVKIFCIGIGTQDGELIQITGENGNRTFLKDEQGNVVKSRLNETLLKRIALAGGGTYVRSSGAEFGLDLIYEEKLSSMEKRDLKTQMNKLYHERFQIPLGLALALLVVEPFISDKKRR